MIIAMAAMLIFILILAVGWWAEISKNRALKIKLAELNLQTQAAAEQVAEVEQGAFVKIRKARTATPETFRNVFDLDSNGQRVIDHLESKFASTSTYVRGGQEAERESCYRAGQASVIGYIFSQINRANNSESNEE
jgi:hypothetical protein